MRNILLALTLSFSITFLFGQKESVFFLGEFSVSMNRTNLKDNNTSDGIGFGLGAYHTFLKNKKVNLIFGFEYNRTTQEKEYMSRGHFSHATNITYSIDCLSIPLNARVYFGNHVRVFVESGAFIDLTLGAKENGTMHTYSPTEGSPYSEYEYKENTDISPVNYGVSLGMGILVPISKVDLIIKPEYKYGFKPLYDYHDQIFNRYFRLVVGIKI
ncbi:MAG: hypothetical protein DRJ05_12150 [Bacteroidetes bacterium]|nr:MAG: hypothetical protein DRJ05_12150 [Bacteroidota bacterium]